jgi:hypothetical protein
MKLTNWINYKLLKVSVINIISILFILYIFEVYLEQKFYNEESPENVGVECNDVQKISYVDSQGPGLIRDESLGNFLNPKLSYTNNMGFLGECHKERRNENELIVAVIGDSFTASTQVAQKYTWPNLLKTSIEKEFPNKEIKLLNFATGGHGLDQQNKQLSHSIDTYNPDLVIQSLFLGNDFTDSDYPSFLRSQPKHKQFANRTYLTPSGGDGDIKKISSRLDYYLMMNFLYAIKVSGNTLFLENNPIKFNTQWKWNNSKNLDDRFSITAEYDNKEYLLKSYSIFPTKDYKASKKAISIVLFNNEEELHLDVLRHDPKYFNWKTKNILATIAYVNVNKSIKQVSKEQFFTTQKQKNIEIGSVPSKSEEEYLFYRAVSFFSVIFRNVLFELGYDNVVMKNGSFDNNLEHWIADNSALISNVNKRLRVDKPTGFAYQKVETVPSETYIVSADAYLGTALSAAIYIDTDENFGGSFAATATKLKDGPISIIFKAKKPATFVQLRQNTGTDGYVEFDNVNISRLNKNDSDNEIKFRLDKISKGDLEIGGIPLAYQIYGKNINEFIANSLKIFEIHFKSMKELHSKSKGSLLFTIPAAMSASENYWKTTSKYYFTKGNEEFDREMPEIILKSIAEKNNIEYSSFYDFLHEKRPNSIDIYYSKEHRHFTIEGHKLYESFIRDKVIKELKRSTVSIK